MSTGVELWPEPMVNMGILEDGTTALGTINYIAHFNISPSTLSS